MSEIIHMDENNTYWKFVAYWDALLEPMTSPQDRQELYIPLWNDLSDYWRIHGPPTDKRPTARNEIEELSMRVFKRPRRG